MPNGIVVNVFYNRTIWPAGQNDRERQYRIAVPMTKDFSEALLFGKYCPAHEYESVHADWDPNAFERDWPEVMWNTLQNDDETFPIKDRSMCIGDVVVLSRIEDEHFTETKLGTLTTEGFTVHDIAAWIAVPVGFEPCPQFLERLR